MPSPSLLFPFPNEVGNNFSFTLPNSNQDGSTGSPEAMSVNSGNADVPMFPASNSALPVKARRVAAKKTRRSGKGSSRKALVLRTQDGTLMEKPKRKFRLARLFKPSRLSSLDSSL